jgi:hypothetical protein
MGKVVGTIAKVAAVAAIAYFAPPLAAKAAPALLGKAGASIMASKLGATVATSVVGAGIGAAGGAVGIPGLDAQSGAFAGALGASGLFGKPQTSIQGALSNLGIGAKTTAAGSAAGSATGAAVGGTAVPGVSGLGAGGTSLAGGMGSTGVGSISTGTSLAAGTGPTSLGGALGGAGAGATSLGGTLGGTAGATLPTGLGAGGTSMVAGMGATGIAPISPDMVAAGGGVLAGLGTGLRKAAPSLISAGLVGSAMSGQMRAQQEELERARAANAAFTQERFNQAQRLLGEADFFNPEYMGRQAGQAALVRGAIQEGEATRGLTGARLAAEQRRFRLGTARNVGTAFQQGFGQGVGARLQTRGAGISAIPTAFPLTTQEGSALEEQRIQQRNAERKGIGLILGDVLGVPPITAPADQPAG